MQWDCFVAEVQISVLGSAENCITVGGSKSLQLAFKDTWGACFPDKFPSDPLKTETIADNIKGRAASSSREPTNLRCASDQQLVKPDVVAPGTFILSARSRNANREMWKQVGWAEGAREDCVYMGGSS
jgi:serine protease AprX